MAKSASALAAKLLEDGPGSLEEFRIHVFEDDMEAHDDEAVARLYEDFAAEFERVKTQLSKKYGKPTRTGTEEDDTVPLNGVQHFAIWKVGKQELYAAVAHEDTEVPIILMLGTGER